ncbi:MAG: hypothetical protein ABW278_09600 [Steroidobacteraceae bacterium]
MSALRGARQAVCGLFWLLVVACSPPVTGPATELPAVPDWHGVWVAADTDIDISGYPAADSPAGMAIDLLDIASAPWNERQRAWMQAELPGIWAADARRRAQGWGYPLMMEGVAPMQFIVTPRETLILNFYRDLRHVYTDGRALPAAEDRWPTPWGDSIGHWEGDTLVIETVSVRNGSVLPLPLPPLTPEARFSERLRQTGPDTMELAMTIEDPAVLTGPWELKFLYKRAAGIDRLIHDIADNDRSQVDGEGLTIAPPR